MPSKTLTTSFSSRERFAIWFHITRNIQAQTRRDQEKVDDLYTTLQLDEFDVAASAAKVSGTAVDIDDFSVIPVDGVTLARDELSYLLSVLARPMTAALSRELLPITRRLEKERDQQGVNAPAEE